MSAPVDLSTTLGNAWFPSPVFTASGCASSGKELAQFFPLKDIGAVVTKSVMNKPRHGRPTPRMAETPSGMLNSIGLQGPGIDAFLANDVPWLLSQGSRVIVSIAGETIDEYAVLARKIRSTSGISAIEVNISCPNVENRGLVFAAECDTAARVIEGVRKVIGGEIPIFAKLTPDVTNIVEVARAVADAGADGVALINTVLGMVINIDTMKPHLGGKTGGLSGPAIRPVAVRAIYQVHEALPNLPMHSSSYSLALPASLSELQVLAIQQHSSQFRTNFVISCLRVDSPRSSKRSDTHIAKGECNDRTNHLGRRHKRVRYRSTVDWCNP